MRQIYCIRFIKFTERKNGNLYCCYATKFENASFLDNTTIHFVLIYLDQLLLIVNLTKNVLGLSLKRLKIVSLL